MEIITSKDNQRLRAARKLFSDKDARYESRTFAVEGIRLVAEAVRLGLPVRSLFVGEGAQYRYGDKLEAILPVAEAVFRLPDHLMDGLSDTRTPQGVVAVVGMPDAVPAPMSGPTLLLCGLQEPGNVGAIIRTAVAFGVHVVLAEPCPDPYSPKVLRASAGGVMTGTVVAVAEAGDYIAARREAGSPIYAAVLRPDSKRLQEVELGDALVLLGNEGAGLPDRLIALTDSGLYIPIRETIESLNVAMAAGLIAYEMMRGGIS